MSAAELPPVDADVTARWLTRGQPTKGDHFLCGVGTCHQPILAAVLAPNHEAYVPLPGPKRKVSGWQGKPRPNAGADDFPLLARCPICKRLNSIRLDTAPGIVADPVALTQIQDREGRVITVPRLAGERDMDQAALVEMPEDDDPDYKRALERRRRANL